MKKYIHDKRKQKAKKRPIIQSFLSNTYVVIMAAVVCFLFVFFSANFSCQFFKNAISYLSNIKNFQNQMITIPNPFILNFQEFKYVYIISAISGLILGIRLAYKLKVNFSKLEHDQKGSRTWASIDELKTEYRSVPEKKEYYKGKPGFPVSRYKDKIFIDDSPVNNLIIGTTRSGKGELFVFSAIDIYSRSKLMENRASMIISDPKGELVAASKDVLINRGYNVEIFDIDTFKGMSYNPLEIIKEAYMEGDLPAAQMLANTLSHILFFDPNAKEKVWQDWSMSLTNALILATVIDCCDNAAACSLTEDKEEWYQKINMYSATRLLTDYSNEIKGKYELDKFFEQRPANDLARIEYSSVRAAQGVTKGSIIASTLSVLIKFTSLNIAKMGCKNSLDLKTVGFDGEKPTAVFLVLPDNDLSCHFYVTMFISQLYYILVKECKKAGNSGKCKREVIFLLDEFGNIVSIPNMSNILNVCLGRNIRFDLIIQAYSQIYKLYGNEDGKSIIGSCANQIYLLTIELETAKHFSELIGNETIIVRSRTGSPVSINKHITEMVDSKPLLNPNELMELMPGENVVCRVAKRQNLKDEKIVPNPIFNNDRTIMKYRYEYLGDTFDNSKSFGDLKNNMIKECRHENIALHNYVYRPLMAPTFNLDLDCIAASVIPKKVMKDIADIICRHFEISQSDVIKMNITEIDVKLNILMELGFMTVREYERVLDSVKGGINVVA